MLTRVMVVGLAHSSIFFRPLALEPMYLASHPCSRGHAVHYTVQEILVRLGVAMVLTLDQPRIATRCRSSWHSARVKSTPAPG